jgi:hypothetical protein
MQIILPGLACGGAAPINSSVTKIKPCAAQMCPQKAPSRAGALDGGASWMACRIVRFSPFDPAAFAAKLTYTTEVAALGITEAQATQFGIGFCATGSMRASSASPSLRYGDAPFGLEWQRAESAEVEEERGEIETCLGAP